MKLMQKVAVIGAGISGLTVAHLLEDRYNVTVFEKEATPGGLIRCKRINGSLYHICGGHVFNSKRQDVLKWFWSLFDRNKEFVKADRNSVVFLQDGNVVEYPVENHAYQFKEKMLQSFIKDLVQMAQQGEVHPSNFEEFLKTRFGETLYNAYFQPYNEKIWDCDLKQIPLSWLKGKLPMPTIDEIIYNNIKKVEEKSFVHSSFWYEKSGGSQLIANRLAEGLDIIYNADIQNITYILGKGWTVGGKRFDKVVFCGNLKELPKMLEGVDMGNAVDFISTLAYHGTTTCFCEIAPNPYSWCYLPSREYKSHRIICTGNFSSSNNAPGASTGTIEFTDNIFEDEIKQNLSLMPLHPKYITSHFSKFTYPIQNVNTRENIHCLKEKLKPFGFYFTGRFADWEYYNMDAAIGAAMDLCEKI